LLTYKHGDGAEGAQLEPGLRKKCRKSHGGKTYTPSSDRPQILHGKPVKAPTHHAVERCSRPTRRSVFLHRHRRRGKFAETKQGGIPGIKTKRQDREVVINLTKPRGTFSQRARPDVRRPGPGRTRRTKTSRPTRPPATGPYMLTNVQPGKGLGIRTQPLLGQDNSKAMPE